MLMQTNECMMQIVKAASSVTVTVNDFAYLYISIELSAVK